MKIISKVKGYLLNMKIQKKLILIYVVSTLIPILFLGVILTDKIRNMSISSAISEASTNNERVESRLDELLKLVNDVSDRLYLDSNLQKLVTEKYENSWEVVDSYSKYTVFETYLRSYKEIKNIKIYADNDKLLNNSQFIGVTPEISYQSWYAKAIEKNGKTLWQFIDDDISHERNLCLTRFIKNIYGEKIGVLVILISNDYLKSLINDEPFETMASLDKQSVMLSSSVKNNDKKVLTISDMYDKESKSSMDYNGIKYIIIKNNFKALKSDNTFYIFTLLPVHAITNTANQIGLLGFEIIGFSILIAIILILLFSRAFSSRIMLFRKEMHKVVTGDFNISSKINGNDEIGDLFHDLKIMIDSINELILEVYKEKLLKEQLSSKQKEIEFKMLASQINPHFLYNALETIRMEAHYNGQDKIAQVVKVLGKMLRRNLDVSNKLVSLESEIELLENYLFIQRFRFGERVSYNISIDTEINSYYILPLLLQPLVENAFIHGLENKLQGGIIYVIISKEDNFLIVTIEDNGIGMTEEKLLLICEKLYKHEDLNDKNIGLCNVHNRIKLFYGEAYGIKVFSKINEGTKIVITLPKEGDSNVKSINY